MKTTKEGFLAAEGEQGDNVHFSSLMVSVASFPAPSDINPRGPSTLESRAHAARMVTSGGRGRVGRGRGCANLNALLLFLVGGFVVVAELLQTDGLEVTCEREGGRTAESGEGKGSLGGRGDGWAAARTGGWTDHLNSHRPHGSSCPFAPPP